MHLVNEDLPENFFLIDEHRTRFAGAHEGRSRGGVGWSGPSRRPTGSRRSSAPRCAEGHAFTLEDNILTGNCFGCQEGGDVISFLMKIDGLSFAEALERLADKYGVVLRREDGDAAPSARGARPAAG